MAKVSLRSLVLENFRTFKGRHTIEFPDKGLAIIKGRNLETRGDSGSGKTNVLLALAYLLGYCRFPVDKLKTWGTGTDEPLRVTGTFWSEEDGLIEISRQNHGRKLHLSVDGGSANGSVKETEAEIDELLGVPGELREILTYRDQVKPQRFLAMRDAAMKEFLTQVLGIQALDKEIEVAVLQLNQATVEEERAREQVAIRQHALTNVRTAAQPLQLEDVSAPREALALLQQELEGLRTVLVGAQADLVAAIVSERERAAGLESAAMAKGVALEEKLAKAHSLLLDLTKKEALAEAIVKSKASALHKQAMDMERALNAIYALRPQVERLEAEIAKLGNDTCFTCDRTWDKARALIDSKQRQIQEMLAKLDGAPALSEQMDAVYDEARGTVFEPDPRVAKLQEVQLTLQKELGKVSAEARAAGLEVLLDPDRPSVALKEREEELKAKVQHVQVEASAMVVQIQNLEKANRLAQDQYQQQLKLIERFHGEEESAANLAEEAKAKKDVQEDYVSLLKGFRNKIFDEVLQAIGTEATAIIASLPNAQHIAVEFRSERETKKAVVQERITPVVTIYGEEHSPEEALSGGQMTSLSLAVDLAIIRVISGRLGCNLNWVVFDESFNGHDPVTKASCLEMLNQYASDKLVIVIDHTSEFKELFAKTIVVEYNNKQSRICE